MTRHFRAAILGLASLLSACATRPEPVAAVAPPPLPPPPVPVAMPAGTYPGMPVPASLADGGYATPNRGLSSAGTIWHLRAGLNFAALGCRGAEESAIIAGYNAMLAAQRPALAAAEKALTEEYRATGGAQWRDSYDDAMTRLYNYYALAPARAALCATAARLLTEAQGVPVGSFATFAAAGLPALDAGFTDVYRAYDAWRAQRPRASYAVAAAIPAGPMAVTDIAAGTEIAQPARGPWIEVDPAVLRTE